MISILQSDDQRDNNPREKSESYRIVVYREIGEIMCFKITKLL